MGKEKAIQFIPDDPAVERIADWIAQVRSLMNDVKATAKIAGYFASMLSDDEDE